MSKRTILIVEDDEWLAGHYERVIQQEGHRVAVVSNAMAAIDVIDEIKPDVLLLDVILTGPTGLSLLHELQSYRDTSQIPVVLATNAASHLSLEDLSPYGVRRILDKAKMEPSDIIAAIRSVT